MRELKFRAWDIDNKAWIYSNHQPGLAWFFELVEQYNCIVEQYTGLHDKDGREIYEGDIVRAKKTLNGTITDSTKKEEAFFVERCKRGGFSPFIDSVFLDVNYIIYAFDCEVIGNCHEHPELLQ